MGITARFASDDDDIFMRSMINNYALDEKTAEDKKTGYKGGEPTGKFWMDEFAAKAAASEVLAPIKLSAELISPLTSTPTSKRPGDISMLTEPDTLRSSRCQCSSDSSPLINTSNSSNQSERKPFEPQLDQCINCHV